MQVTVVSNNCWSTWNGLKEYLEPIKNIGRNSEVLEKKIKMQSDTSMTENG